jgi:CheY-like chemotaxis protein
MTTDALEILMVEDDREQAELIIDTARVCRSTIRWGVIEDGESALQRLRSAAAARPGLVLLDLHLPKLDGIEVLRAIKNDPALKGLPVIIMSSSRDESDINAVYALGANCYIAKPGSFEGLCSLVRFLEAFLSLPQAGGGGQKPPVPGSPAHSLN